ncbi:MAG: MBL fold metallo-hydrolase [Elusimicrobia bacterium GWF2_52_66]|nr:MAG: MBL fold metallo-hydrolase [Elusimicrobia bacterium GWA2_51_34]OGR85265.1 MAG: MBL fold metallo-hydrolase [Elusimicrobia bacterium GWF2_52_66]HAF95791.1 MBL fold metallo-hydrolase [Elusimicrobiota bacterium]HCE99163.1 MBL fold metallo-hydrolase [Elusimicrobiota bacterium]
MDIIFLGTNGWYDTCTGNTVCALVKTKRFDIVLDAGNGLAKLDRYCDGSKPVYLFLSHFHLDHIIGLHTLLKFRFREGLTICAGTGARSVLHTFVNNPFTMPLARLPYRVKIIELPAEASKLPFKVESRPLKHSDPVLGLRLRIDGKTLVYCTDTGYCLNALKLATRADLLVTECSHLPGESNPGWPHFNPETAAGLAVKAGAGRLVLTHFSADRYPDMRRRAMALRVARKIFTRTTAAKDGLRIKL